MVSFIAPVAALAIVLFFAWYYGRSRVRGSRRATPDRGLAGEAATALEDIARDLIRSGDTDSARREATKKPAARR